MLMLLPFAIHFQIVKIFFKGCLLHTRCNPNVLFDASPYIVYITRGLHSLFLLCTNGKGYKDLQLQIDV